MTLKVENGSSKREKDYKEKVKKYLHFEKNSDIISTLKKHTWYELIKRVPKNGV